MPIKIMLTNHGAVPIILCDVCGARIERADDGAYAWDEQRPESGALHDLTIMHRGDCFAAYEAEHGPSTRDMPLIVLLPYLATNLSADWKAETAMAAHFSTQ